MPNCKRPANSFCTSRACKSCCLKVNGGCSGVRGHRAANSQSQRTLSIFPPPSQPTTTSLSPIFAIDPALSYDSFAELLRQDDPVRRLRDECSTQAAAERQAASREAQLEAQEEAEFQKAISRSMESPPSSPIASTSSLPNLPPAPQTTTTITMGGLPVTRVTTSNRPMITTQMSKDWMRPYEDKSKQAQESPGKGQVDKEVIEKFHVVWWEKVCCLIWPSSFYLHVYRMMMILLYLPYLIVLAGPSGKSRTLPARSSAWGQKPSSSMTLNTGYGLKHPYHTLTQ